MAMITSLLEAELITELTTQHALIFPEVSGDPNSSANATRLIQFISKIATPVIQHIQTNAVVTTVVAAGIAVQVSPATGTGATIAPGAGSGTIA